MDPQPASERVLKMGRVPRLRDGRTHPPFLPSVRFGVGLGTSSLPTDVRSGCVYTILGTITARKEKSLQGAARLAKQRLMGRNSRRWGGQSEPHSGPSRLIPGPTPIYRGNRKSGSAHRTNPYHPQSRRTGTGAPDLRRWSMCVRLNLARLPPIRPRTAPPFSPQHRCGTRRQWRRRRWGRPKERTGVP